MEYEGRTFSDFESFRLYRTEAMKQDPAKETMKREMEKKQLTEFGKVLARQSDRAHDYAVYIAHGGIETPEEKRSFMKEIERPGNESTVRVR